MGIYSKFLKPINEVYFGETPGIQKIQKQLSIFRSRHLYNDFDIGINGDPELHKLNRLFEEEFGFEVFDLQVVKEYVYNAFTMPIGYKLDSGSTSSNLISKRDGFKYDKKAGYACIIGVYAGIMNNPTFTDREVLATILHEVGHNFSGAVNKGIGVMYNLHKILLGLIILILLFCTTISPLMGLLGIMVGLMNLNWFTKFDIEFTKRLSQQYPKLAFCLAFMDSIMAKIKDIQGELNFINRVMMTPTIIGAYGPILINSFISDLQQSTRNPLFILKKMFGYGDEQFADDFANIYGYGADLNSGLSKMTFSGGGIQLHDAMNTIPVISQLFNLMWLPIELVLCLFDEHPVAPARIKNNLNTLEAELKKGNLDPKMRKRIENDIKEINKVYEKFYENLDKINEPYLYKKMYFGWLYKRVGGDIKHLISKIHTPEKMDSGYEAALKKVKFK
jgi:hypothetical protein